MFINYHGIMEFMREISKFSYNNDLNLLIIRMHLFHFKVSQKLVPNKIKKS